MSQFKVGDEVEIISNKDGYCPYTYTTVGSRGVITELSEYSTNEVLVAWSFFANPLCSDPIGHKYTVEVEYLKLIKEVELSNPADLKYEKIIRKIKQMEAKRKELGYKTYAPI